MKEKKGNRKMKTVKIELGNIDKIKRFIKEANKCDYDLDLVSGRYIIDAKSIMGIFGMDLMRPLTLNIHSDDKNEIDTLLSSIEEFIVE